MTRKMFLWAGKCGLVLGLALVVVTSAGAVRRYVKPSQSGNGDGLSWANASGNLQVTINACSVGDEVWVAAGTYKPTLDPYASATPTDNRDKTFLVKDGIKLYGGFVGTETTLAQRYIHFNRTILSGDIDNDNTSANNSYHVLVASAVAAGGVGVTIDGFSITGGNGNIPGNILINTNPVSKNTGAAIVVVNGTNTISNNRIYGNAVTSLGGGIHTNAGINTIHNNWFYQNSSGNVGGAMRCFNGSQTVTNNFVQENTASGTAGGFFIQPGTGLSSTIDNNVFYGNSSNTSGGGVFANGQTITLSHNTFVNNSAGTNNGGLCANSNAVMTFSNNIFVGNTKAGSATDKGSDYGFNNAPTGTVTAYNNILQLASIAEYNVTTTGGNNIGTHAGNKFAISPSFVDISNPLGNDGLVGTVDDGLRVNCGSPALASSLVGAGIPTADITGAVRGAVNGTIGAYEGSHGNATLATSAKTLTVAQSGLTTYGVCGDYLIGAVLSNGALPLSNNVQAKVWIESTQGSYYVKRHFELAPVMDAATATGRVTLYFTQTDFNDFNAVASVDLPTGTADATGKANLKIERLAGTSSNGSGLPASYSGTVETIDPVDSDITWNAMLSRWEVSFNTTGFGGFLLKTVDAPLPLKLLAFTAAKNGERNRLVWKTATEDPNTLFIVQRSADGVVFTEIGQVQGNRAEGQYVFEDSSPLSPMAYYRLKAVSAVAEVLSELKAVGRSLSISVKLVPVPAVSELTISVEDPRLVGSKALVSDIQGRRVAEFRLEPNGKLDISVWAKGAYFIRIADGNVLRIVKE